jgi:hypothetical protein
MTLQTETPATCEKCGLSTLYSQLLVSSPRSFRRSAKGRARRICPRCAAKDYVKTIATMYVLGLVAVSFLTGLGLFGHIEPGEKDQFQAILEFNWTILIAEPLLALLHELAHAAVARAVGMRVFGISVGTGPLIADWRLGKSFFRLRMIPLGGFCWMASTSNDSSQRLRIILAILAGPAVHIVAIGLLLVLFPIPHPLDSISQFQAWWLTFAGINLMLLVGNLWPRMFSRDGLKIPNDGMQIRYLLSKDGFVTLWSAVRNQLEMDYCLENGLLDEAYLWLKNLRAASPSAVVTAVYEYQVRGAGRDWQSVLDLARQHLNGAQGSLNRYCHIAWAAVAIVYSKGDLADADAFATEALAVTPWDSAVQTIRATVLVAQGRFDEAAQFLKKAKVTQSNWAAKVAGTRAWEHIYRVKGDTKRHAKWKCRAEALDPNGAFIIPEQFVSLKPSDQQPITP